MVSPSQDHGDQARAVVSRFDPEEVEGWLAPREGRLLHTLARQCTGRGVIVEIGSWKGKSTIFLALGAKAGNGPRVYAVDPHTGSEEHHTRLGEVWTFDEFTANLKRAGVHDQVVPIVKPSGEAARDFKEPVELLFIDGDHEWAAVNADFEDWSPRVVPGGIIAFHDTTKWPGPRRVVRERVYRSPSFVDACLVGALTFAWKVDFNSRADRLRNRWVLFLKDTLHAERGLPHAMRKPAKWLLNLHCRLALRSHLDAPWGARLGELIPGPGR